MPRKSKYEELATCSEHKLEHTVWGSDFDRGICVQCLKEKVDLLWEIASKKYDS